MCRAISARHFAAREQIVVIRAMSHRIRWEYLNENTRFQIDRPNQLDA
jgi:hypothetical protein